MSHQSETTSYRGRAEAERLFVEHLVSIERLMQRVAQRKGLYQEQAEEFAGWAKLRLVQNEYRILRRYRGDSSLLGYLTTVLLRLALDYIIQEKGKWRPSKAVERQGPVAVQLETLVYRDGRTLDEAIEILRSNFRVELSDTELRRLATFSKKDKHTGRPRLEGADAVERLPSGEQADHRLEEAERSQMARRVARALAAALDELPSEDRLIVRLLFEEGLPLSQVARQLSLNQRRLYTRRDSIFRRLRQGLQRHGVDADEVAQLVGWGSWTEAVAEEDRADSAENEAAGPSLEERRQAPAAKRTHDE